MTTIEPFDVTIFAFLFDVDGTLIDIAPTPQSVKVPASLRRNLQQLGRLTKGATALVSGRPLSELDRLFGQLGLSLVGGHGAEVRLSRQGSTEEQRTPALPDWVRQRCAQIAALSNKVLIEDKGYSIAIHYRRVPEQEQPIHAAVAAIVAEDPAGDLDVLHGKAVVEIKRAGLNKGSGIRALMMHAPFAGRRPVFVGDDVTDEDAFAAMPEFDGIAFSVGRSVVGAKRRFESPAEVRRWIAHMCQSVPRAP
jgi:trehalose 6-phosphate phosphatase